MALMEKYISFTNKALIVLIHIIKNFISMHFRITYP